MAINDLSTPFPLLDADPHAGRVIRYFRPSDYALWATGTAIAPIAIYSLRQSLIPLLKRNIERVIDFGENTELADPARLTAKGLRPTLKLATWLGFCGGFLLAYQTSSRSSFVPLPSLSLTELTERLNPIVRLWGWKENSLEQERDMAELSALAKAGKPLYGETDLPNYVQGVAHRNSLWSQLKFGVLPWSVYFSLCSRDEWKLMIWFG